MKQELLKTPQVVSLRYFGVFKLKSLWCSVSREFFSMKQELFILQQLCIKPSGFLVLIPKGSNVIMWSMVLSVAVLTEVHKTMIFIYNLSQMRFFRSVMANLHNVSKMLSTLKNIQLVPFMNPKIKTF